MSGEHALWGPSKEARGANSKQRPFGPHKTGRMEGGCSAVGALKLTLELLKDGVQIVRFVPPECHLVVGRR